MAANRHDPPDLNGANKPEVRHEPNVVNTRAIVKFGIAFVVLGIITQFLVWYVFDVFRTREQSAKGRPPVRELDVDARQLPPEPRLQPAPITDLKQMHAAEDEILNGYGWADRANGVVRIPVSRALELIARDGLPARNVTAPQSASTATVPRESGLGPIVHQAGGPLSPNRTFPTPQPLQLHGNGNPLDGRAAGGPPTPPEQSLANTGEPEQQQKKQE